MNIKHVSFPPKNYFNEDTPKKQVYLHHTAGNDDAEAVFRYWTNNKVRIATCVAIDSKGLIVQGFSSKKWAKYEQTKHPFAFVGTKIIPVIETL